MRWKFSAVILYSCIYYRISYSNEGFLIERTLVEVEYVQQQLDDLLNDLLVLLVAMLCLHPSGQQLEQDGEEVNVLLVVCKLIHNLPCQYGGQL